jgi:hypothetical protein
MNAYFLTVVLLIGSAVALIVLFYFLVRSKCHRE